MEILKLDEWGYITFSLKNAKSIAKTLLEDKNVFVSVATQNTHYDVLFSLFPRGNQNIAQGGVRRSDLFISIMRKGAFGFGIGDSIDTNHHYYSEKLTATVTEELSDFFNLVRAEIYKLI